jgi:penicillin-binding protein 1A
VLPVRVAQDMIKMMNSVVENGTGRRARLDGIAVAGKTGTTNAFRDGWFMGYTGNFVCGVWMGNDDYSSTNRMTGGSLPAMTWHSIMAYAHQGIEIKPLPGIPAPPPRQPEAVALKTRTGEPAPPPRPVMLTKRGADVLSQIERMMDDASRALGPPPQAALTGTVKHASKKGDALAAALEGRAFERN